MVFAFLFFSEPSILFPTVTAPLYISRSWDFLLLNQVGWACKKWSQITKACRTQTIRSFFFLKYDVKSYITRGELYGLDFGWSLQSKQRWAKVQQSGLMGDQLRYLQGILADAPSGRLDWAHIKAAPPPPCIKGSSHCNTREREKNQCAHLKHQ